MPVRKASYFSTGRGVFAVALAATALWPHASQAQDTSVPGERTGQEASVPQPDYAEPVEFPTAQTPQPPAIPSVLGSAYASSLEVLVSSDAAAQASGDFSGIADAAYALEAKASPGTRLDEQWVTGQFQANGLIGQPVALERLVAMVQLINRAFVANGYINSGVLIVGDPPTAGGVLTLRIVTGKLVGTGGGIDLNWADDQARGLSTGFVVARMPATQQRPLNVIDLERDFRLLAEDPAIQSVSADLQPGTTAGEARLNLTVRPAQRGDITMGFANSRSPAIGGERVSVGGTVRNLVAAGDIVSVEAGLTSGEPDARLAYSTPLGRPELTLNVLGGFNEAAVVDPELLPLDISASDWNAEGGLAYRLFVLPLTPDPEGNGWISARSLTVGTRIGHRNSKTRLLGRPFSLSPGAVDGRAHYTVARLTADFVQRGINTVLAVSITGTQGLDGSRGDIPELITPDRDFRTVNLQTSYARLLSERGLELRMRLSGQYADGILYSGERLAAGGRQTVRGYRETLALADQGVIGSIELAHPFHLTPRRGSSQEFDWGAFSASVFVDGALLDNRDVEDPVADRLISVGAGLQWRPATGLQASVAYAHSLRDVVAPGQRDLQDRGVHFAITFRPLELFRW